MAGPLFKTFVSTRMAQVAGVDGSVMLAQNADRHTPDAHLGDVIVGGPGDGKPACLYCNLGRRQTAGQLWDARYA